jgi:hypothetical protein
MSRNIIFVIICHRHKLLDLIYFLFPCSLETRSFEGMHLAHVLPGAPFHLIQVYLAKGFNVIAEC